MEISSSPWNDGGYSPYERNRAAVSPLSPPMDNDERIESPQSLGDHCFKPLPYLTNYLSMFALFSNEIFGDKVNVSSQNEYLLKKYYSLKKPFALRHSGGTSKNSDMPSQSNDIWQTNFMVDRFLNRSVRSVNYANFQIISDMQNRSIRGTSIGGTPEHGIDTFQTTSLPSIPSAVPYFQYYRKLLTVNTKEWDILKLHSLWIPDLRTDFKDFELCRDRDSSRLYDDDYDEDNVVKKDLFFEKIPGQQILDGEGYVPKEYEISSGSLSIPSLFSEDKLPALTYHCAVELNKNVYIFGGLMPCYSYEEDAPLLNDFFVDGIKNLPPPLLPQVINNPSMVNNPHLYVAAVPSCRFSKPKMRGYIPPPLLCVQGSKLTERHIFFYGGFEIRTETRGDENGKYHLKKRLYVNNTGYILDIISLKFTKIDVIVQSSKYNAYPTMSARFGHLQISIDNQNRRNSVHSVNTNESHTAGSASMKRGPSMSKGRLEKSAVLSSLSHNSSAPYGVHTIIIFGGYRQTGDDRYEAMNDLWKIEIPVMRRGKKGYCKFSETANAILLTPREKDKLDWPEERAFAAFSLHGTSLMDRSALETSLLSNLKKYFILKPSYISKDRVIDPKPVFPMMVHSTHQDLFNGSSATDEPSISGVPPSRSSADSTIGPEMNYDFDNMTMKPGVNLSSIPMSTIGRQRLILSQDMPIRKNIILHGGSNGLNVLDDMWLMDLECETWTPIETFTRAEPSKSVDEKLDTVNVGLVGHEMESIGRICVCIGGMLQEDVNAFYSGDNDEPSKNQSVKKLPLGGHFLNTIDLSTQCWEDHQIILSKKEDNEDGSDNENEDVNSNVVVGIGGTSLQCDKSIVMIGGLMSRRTNLKEIYLHGTILKSILPSVHPGN